MANKPELSSNAVWADEAFAKRVLPHRDVGSHKWGVGGVVVVAGSPSLQGAAWLTCRAAGRAGAGIVNLAASRGVIATLAGAMPEVAHIPLPETDVLGAARMAAERIAPRLEKSKSVVIGPGLGEDEMAHHLLSTLFGFGGKSGGGYPIGFGFGSDHSAEAAQSRASIFFHEHLKFVIDADALNWLATRDAWWTHVPGDRVILTPHVGEMARLTGLATDEILAAPQDIASHYATEWGTTVLLKTGYSVVSSEGSTLVAPAAPVSLATAGSGDVLAGMIGAFLAQGLEPFDAAGLSLHAGSKAATALEERFGELGVIATDLPEAIAGELRNLA